MPIGKNAIKRVANNGYSNVKTSAPDMENSEIESKKSEDVAEKKSAPKKTSTQKTGTQKKTSAPKKSAAATKPSAPKAPRVTEASKTQGIEHLSLGDELPVYLL